VTNLAALLDTSAQAYPERIAIVSGEARLTYAEVDAAANRVANLLVERGVRPGDKVAVSAPNIPAFTVVYYGILKAGAAVVPLNILLKPREIAYHLADSDASAYFAYEGTSDLPLGASAREAFELTESCSVLVTFDADPGLGWLAEQSPTFETLERDEDDTAVILYTSGTTGQPKGAELRHRNLRDNALTACQVAGSDPEAPDVYLAVLPLFHTFGQTNIQNGAMVVGGTVVMIERFTAEEALATILRERVTFFAGVPTMFWGLLQAAGDADDRGSVRLDGQLRIAVSGGAALPAEIHKQFKNRFGVTILEGYGLSETSPLVSLARYGEEPRVGSIGVPIPGVEMKLINDDWSDVEPGPDAVGEIAIKGHNVMKGYYDRPEATAEAIHDGWFRTGDLAKKDEDGFYYIVDRSKDMIIRGGYNVYPREIEEVLMTHPAVSLVAVIGVPDDQHGEEIKAVVVKNKDHDDVTEADLVAWGKEQFAAYKYPRVVEFLDELPMTSTGKILKRELS
jgi:long-chain acyl-CoA synthetase